MANSATDIRAAIDKAVEGKTVVDIFARNAAEHPLVPAIHWRDGDRWKELTWSEYRARVVDVAAGLIDLGIGRGDFVALMAANRPEHVIADLGVVHAAATPVTLYSTLATSQVACHEEPTSAMSCFQACAARSGMRLATSR